MPADDDGLQDMGPEEIAVVGFDEVPDGYGAMSDRESIKVMVAP